MNSRLLLAALLLTAPIAAQSRTQVVFGGFPFPQAMSFGGIATHSQGLNVTRSESQSFSVPQFDPSMGQLRGVSINYVVVTSTGAVNFTSSNTSFGPRSVSLRCVTSVTLTDPSITNPTLTTDESLSGTLPAFQQSLSFSGRASSLQQTALNVPSNALGGWIGAGSRQLGLNLRYDYTGSFVAGATVTWRPALIAQVIVGYTYDPIRPDGVSTRGLPGCGFASIEFDPRFATGYRVEAGEFFDSRFREGEDLGLGDDAFADRSLPFTIEMPNGRMVNNIRIDSNGYVSDPADNLGSIFSPTLADFLQAAGPVLAPCWNDFSPNQAGSVWFRAEGGFASITWSDVTEFNAANSNTFQLQFFDDGRITFVYLDMNLVRTRQIVGLSEGGVVGTPAETDLSTVLDTPPYVQSVPRTVYEEVSGPSDLNTPATMPILDAVTPPNLGQDYELQVSNTGPAFSAALLFGFRSSTQIGLSLFPGAVGLGDCFLRVNLVDVTTLPMPTVNGITIPIPNDPSLWGRRFAFQVLTVDPSVVNPLSLNFSNGLTATIGG